MASEVDVPEVEREAFALWLRNLWHEKDRLMGRFVKTGSLGSVAMVVVLARLRMRWAAGSPRVVRVVV